MPIHKNLAALAVIGAMATAPVATVAYAADRQTQTHPSDAVAKTTAATARKDAQILRTSDDIYRAMREVRAARLAIFNGAPEQAKAMATNADKDLKAAQTAAKNFAVQTKKSSETGDDYLPFDTSIALAEGFQPTQEKVEKIKQANEHVAKGDQRKAVELLKLADIDVVVSAALLPVNVSIKHAENAVKLLSGGSFYEANLALKAIEDSVLVDSYGIDTVPSQGKAS